MADKTTSSITIAAPRSVVMEVIADFAAYPDWATGVRSATVIDSGPGGRARRVRFVLDAGLVKDSYVLGYEWDGDVAVRWELAEAGSMVSQMSGGYSLVAAASGTDVTYELAVGTRVPMIGMLRRRAEKTIIDTALKGLKSRAEARPPGGAGSSAASGGEGHA